MDVGLYDRTTVFLYFHSLFSLLSTIITFYFPTWYQSLSSILAKLFAAVFLFVSWLFPEVSGCFGISVSRDASSEISVQIGPQINIFRCSSEEEEFCLFAGISYSNSGIRISLFRNSATLSCVPNTSGSPVSDRFSVYL